MTTEQIVCPRAGRWLRGCRWEPRYDVTEPVISADRLPVLMSGDVRHLVRRTVYVRDVCRTCGAKRERGA